MPAASSNWINSLALSLLVLGYVIIGALLFQTLEAGQRGTQQAPVYRYRDECLRELWVITERLNVLYERNWTQLVDAQLRKFERRVVEAARTNDFHKPPRWTFSEAVLYSLTVITTIGYGSTGPHTSKGKVATMLYALVGVPLMLICLSNLGSMFAHSLQKMYSHLCCETNHHPPYRNSDVKVLEARTTLLAVKPNSNNPICRLTQESNHLPRKVNSDRESEEDEIDPPARKYNDQGTPSRRPLIWRAPGESRRAPTPPPRKTPPLHSPSTPRVPPLLVLLLLGAYLALGAFLFSSWEECSLLDAVYFCFVTLSTIGFGDMVPGKRLFRADSGHDYETAICCSYLLLGLILLAAAFSLLQDVLQTKGRHLATSLGLVKERELDL